MNERDDYMSNIKEVFEYNKGYVDGYKEGYYKAISEYQHIINIQTRPIVVTIETNNNIDDITKALNDLVKRKTIASFGV